MQTDRNQHAPEVHDESSLAVLNRVAVALFEAKERELHAEIAALKTQALRYETAINNISQGVCFFDSEERLILCNDRYAEIYRLTPDQVRPGATLHEIAERRFAAGTGAMLAEAYVKLCAEINSSAGPKIWTSELRDGRTVHICHQPMPDGGWVATHEDITELKATRSVAEERVSLQALIDWVPDYLWVKDKESRFIVVNKALASDNGRARTADMIGLTDFDLHAPDMAQGFRASELDILRSGKPLIDEEELIVDESGARKWLSSTKVPLRNDRNEVFGLLGIARDVTGRKLGAALRDGQAQIIERIAANAPLEDALDDLVLLIESQLTGIIGTILLLDKDGVHLRRGAAPSLADTFAKDGGGFLVGPEAGSCGTAVYRREPVVVTDIMLDPLWEDYRNWAAMHGFRSCWSTPILSHEGTVLGTFAMYSRTVRAPTAPENELVDIATHIASLAIERKLAGDHIQFMASHDVLTGLPNRTLLMDRLFQALLHAQRHDRWAAVVFIDLDDFKIINDSLGHAVGDELLRVVARRMTECVGATDTVARIGGDEFVILLADLLKNTDGISGVIQKLRSSIAEPLDLEGHEIRVTSSIGIATFPDDGMSADTLMANADTAMYRAKQTGRDNFQFYTPDLNAKVREKFQLHEELREAVVRSEFVLLYQPQVDLRSGRVFAVEALLRWMHPDLGMVSPVKFIPLAEETGLIVPIGDWVLHEACRQNKAWQDAGLPAMTVCVNVSARQFKEKDLVARVRSALAASGLEARYLELELTESLIMQDVEQALATMDELQALGVQLSIDDFGTGYSSLSALKTFPVARLKIDKSFIDDLSSNDNDKAVASAMISLGQKLNLRVIAEGVETNDQVAFLRENNCDEIQGYHFSKPISSQEIEQLLTEGASGSAPQGTTL